MFDAHHFEEQTRLLIHILEFRRTLRLCHSTSDTDQNAERSGIERLRLGQIEDDDPPSLEQFVEHTLAKHSSIVLRHAPDDTESRALSGGVHLSNRILGGRKLEVLVVSLVRRRRDQGRISRWN